MKRVKGLARALLAIIVFSATDADAQNIDGSFRLALEGNVLALDHVTLSSGSPRWTARVRLWGCLARGWVSRWAMALQPTCWSAQGSWHRQLTARLKRPPAMRQASHCFRRRSTCSREPWSGLHFGEPRLQGYWVCGGSEDLDLHLPDRTGSRVASVCKLGIFGGRGGDGAISERNLQVR